MLLWTQETGSKICNTIDRENMKGQKEGSRPPQKDPCVQKTKVKRQTYATDIKKGSRCLNGGPQKQASMRRKTWWTTSKSLRILTDPNICRICRAWRVFLFKMSEWERTHFHSWWVCHTTAAATEAAGPKLSSAILCAPDNSSQYE